MAYCYNCGVKIVDSDLFCSSCGVKQKNDVKSSEYIHGILFTNTAHLAEKMQVSQYKIKAVLEEYIKQIKIIGLEYSIVDVASYDYLNPKVAFKNKKVSLNSNKNNWLDYSELLADYYGFAYDSDNKPEYLYIVGGNDTIPMPTIENKVHTTGDVKDESVDTDLLYSYMLNRETFNHVISGEIFKYTPYFYIGRLPQGNNPTFEGFQSYFKRCTKVTRDGGLNIQSAYGQTDINWVKVSAIVSETISSNHLFPLEYVSLPDGYKYSNLLTTPNVTIENVDQLFNTKANILYFNMHGSDIRRASPAYSGYIGCYERNSYCGISTFQISELETPNICVSEACYGARYIDYDTNQSMLLSAFNNQTIAFLGSSRIAWGGSDDISCADVICKIFIDAIFEGMPLGVALQIAKTVYAENLDYLQPVHETTLMEFNLFGDPSLMIHLGPSKSSNQRERLFSCTNKSLMDVDCVVGYKVETIFRKDDNSLLKLVRNKVDSTFLEIREKIGKYLYEMYSIEPRNLVIAQKIMYADKNFEYMFYYETHHGDVKISSIGITDSKGNIKNILQSK